MVMMTFENKTWMEHRLCHQRPATPANNHEDYDNDDNDGSDNNDDDDGCNLLHSFAVPAPTSKLRQDVGEPGEWGHLKIIIMSIILICIFIMSMSMMVVKIFANVTSSLDPEH